MLRPAKPLGRGYSTRLEGQRDVLGGLEPRQKRETLEHHRGVGIEPVQWAPVAEHLA